jgi:cytochrome c oxidase subunit 4
MTQASPNSGQKQGAHDEHDHSDEPHVLPLGIYIGVWLALVVLTGVTVAASRFDFGGANTVVALVIATIKGSLVALFFMHLYYDNKLNLIILVTSLLFVSIFFTPVLIDLNTRDILDPIKGHGYWLLSKAKPEPMPMGPVATPATPAAVPAAPAAVPAAPAAAPVAPAAAPVAPAAAPVAPAAAVPAAGHAPAVH